MSHSILCLRLHVGNGDRDVIFQCLATVLNGFPSLEVIFVHDFPLAQTLFSICLKLPDERS